MSSHVLLVGKLPSAIRFTWEWLLVGVGEEVASKNGWTDGNVAAEDAGMKNSFSRRLNTVLGPSVTF
jgi:hypothetical protein